MARPPKDSIPFNIRMRRDVYLDLCDFCENTGRTKTATVEIAVKQYMENEKSMQQQKIVRNSSTLYQRKTKRS